MKRDLGGKEKYILAGFVLIVAATSYGFIRWATGPGRPSVPTDDRERPVATITRVPSERVTLPVVRKVSATAPDYDEIVARNIFEKPETPSSEEKRESRPVATAQPSPPLPAFPSPVMPFVPPVPPPAPPQPPKPPNLTATGVMGIGDEKWVLLENTQTRETALVKVGEFGLGVQVASVGDGYVELRQGASTFRVTLGEGKQERRIGGAPTPAASPTPPTQPAGPPQPGQAGGFATGRRGSFGGGGGNWALRVLERWNQMPDFVRQRILERLRENWDQLPESTRQEIQQRAAQMGINIGSP